ncbi:30S ribosomal protein S6 [Patescibacteria group bacterium]
MNPTKEDTTAPTEEKATLQKYELMVILVPDMSQEETDKELDKIRKELKKLGGEIYHEDIWDVRDLAYIIKKYDKGYYAIFYFTLEDGKGIAEMEKEFKLNHKLIRHLIVKSPKNYEMKKLEDLMLSEEDLKPQKREERSGRSARPIVKKAEPKPAPKAEKVEEKPEPAAAEEPKVAEAEVAEVTEEKVEEKAEKVVEEAPKEEKKEAMDISELDSKLESILDDPDIDLKI